MTWLLVKWNAHLTYSQMLRTDVEKLQISEVFNSSAIYHKLTAEQT